MRALRARRGDPVTKISDWDVGAPGAPDEQRPQHLGLFTADHDAPRAVLVQLAARRLAAVSEHGVIHVHVFAPVLDGACARALRVVEAALRALGPRVVEAGRHVPVLGDEGRVPRAPIGCQKKSRKKVGNKRPFRPSFYR